MTQFHVSWLICILDESYLLSMSAKGSPCAPTTCSANVAATAWNSSSSLMYIYVYICMYMYICTRTHQCCIHICVRLFVYVHVCMFRQLHAPLMSPLLLNIQVCPWCMYSHTWIHIYIYTYIHIYIHIHINVFECIQIFHYNLLLPCNIVLLDHTQKLRSSAAAIAIFRLLLVE